MKAGTVTEKALQAQVLDLARLSGWRVYHTFDSRRSVAGFPDLVMVRPPVVLFAELKTEGGKVRPEQRGWLGALARCETVEASVWRPGDWPRIQEVLKRR